MNETTLPIQDGSAASLKMSFEHSLILGNDKLKKKYEEVLMSTLNATLIEKDLYLKELKLVKAGEKNKIGGALNSEQKPVPRTSMPIDQF